MSNLHKINSLLRNQDFTSPQNIDNIVYGYAEGVAAIENAVVVVSDLKVGISRIFCGEFANILGISNYRIENSIWEKEILHLMDEAELEQKYLSEIRFINYLHKLPRKKRHDYCLVTHLRFRTAIGNMIDIEHRMHYQYELNGSARYGICIYSPTTTARKSKSIVINTLTGETIDLENATGNTILSRREKQVLHMIERGLTSNDIASQLSISRNTVSRHRQEILAKLQVRNSAEACRIARQLGIL